MFSSEMLCEILPHLKDIGVSTVKILAASQGIDIAGIAVAVTGLIAAITALIKAIRHQNNPHAHTPAKAPYVMTPPPSQDKAS
jgi:hypothetical protein